MDADVTYSMYFWYFSLVTMATLHKTGINILWAMYFWYFLLVTMASINWRGILWPWIHFQLICSWRKLDTVRSGNGKYWTQFLCLSQRKHQFIVMGSSHSESTCNDVYMCLWWGDHDKLCCLSYGLNLVNAYWPQWVRTITSAVN